MKCTYELDQIYLIWMIRLNGLQSKEGWTNTMCDNGNLIKEFYTGNPKKKLDNHKDFPTKKRLIFDIIEESYGDREYIFRGVFAISSNSDDNHHFWNKINDEYHF